eukprot:1118622-Amorphochlora_amoeboformis.AAC.1
MIHRLTTTHLLHDTCPPSSEVPETRVQPDSSTEDLRTSPAETSLLRRRRALDLLVGYLFHLLRTTRPDPPQLSGMLGTFLELNCGLA